jgi:hypothetical protein
VTEPPNHTPSLHRLTSNSSSTANFPLPSPCDKWLYSQFQFSNLLPAESESYITTDGQSASVSWNRAPIWGLRPDFYYRQRVSGLLIWGALSDERVGLSFTIAAGPRQRRHLRVRVPWNLWPYYMSQFQDFPLRRLLRLAGLRWRYWTPPPHGMTSSYKQTFVK